MLSEQLRLKNNRGAPPKPKNAESWIDEGQWLIDKVKDDDVKKKLSDALNDLKRSVDLLERERLLKVMNNMSTIPAVKKHWSNWTKHLNNVKTGITKVEICNEDLKLLKNIKELNNLSSNQMALHHVLKSISVLFPYNLQEIKDLPNFFNNYLEAEEVHETELEEAKSIIKQYKEKAEFLYSELCEVEQLVKSTDKVDFKIEYPKNIDL